MNRNAKKLSRAVLVAMPAVTVGALSLSRLEAEAPQSSISAKPPATATSAAAPSSAKPTPASSPSITSTSAPTTPASSGSLKRAWRGGNPEPGVFERQGRRGGEGRSKACWTQLPSNQDNQRRNEKQQQKKIEAKIANRFC